MPRRSRKPYHHGDLRRALLDASIAILEQAGPDALTLRAAARKAGVSHTAPYRHFADQNDLLAAIAEEGFLSLQQAMRAAAAKGKNAIDALERSGVAYVALALEHPAHCSVMFGRDAADLRRSADASPQVVASHSAGHAAFAGLVQLIEQAQRDGFIRNGDANEFAYVAWSTVHGIATLAMTRMLDGEDEQPWDVPTTLAFARRALETLSRGFAPAG
jgi:AcrR family transcriptional regulator